MKATAELQVIPIGNGVSVRKEVIDIISILTKKTLFSKHMHPVVISKVNYHKFYL